MEKNEIIVKIAGVDVTVNTTRGESVEKGAKTLKGFASAESMERKPGEDGLAKGFEYLLLPIYTERTQKIRGVQTRKFAVVATAQFADGKFTGVLGLQSVGALVRGGEHYLEVGNQKNLAHEPYLTSAYGLTAARELKTSVVDYIENIVAAKPMFKTTDKPRKVIPFTTDDKGNVTYKGEGESQLEMREQTCWTSTPCTLSDEDYAAILSAAQAKFIE